MTKERAWAGFWILSLVWGASFLFIRIGVEQLSTFQLVFYRTGIAAVGLAAVAAARGKSVPRDWASIRD
ncbi:MAG TPA: EamA family transporter, partial [Gemmatimonadales bacterium]|nr:EamA family transporter [Gemmatimonadales bacterium]